MPSQWAKDRMKNPRIARQHCANMRARKAHLAIQRVRDQFAALVGKDWHAACSEHFGIENTARGWAVAGLMGEGYERAHAYMLEVIANAGARPTRLRRKAAISSSPCSPSS